MQAETLIYALEKGESRDYMETLIACNVNLDIEGVKKAAAAMGWHSFRIAYFNGEKPNFAKALNV
jgi:hypothetical protein